MPTDEAIDEAVARIMEENGATAEAGWKWRELRDHAETIKAIILEMLNVPERVSVESKDSG